MTKYHSNRTDYYFWLGASADAETGSREPGVASRPGPAGFDPARVPPGYIELPHGTRCRCFRLWTDGDKAYCCNRFRS